MRRELAKALFDHHVAGFSPRMLEARRWNLLRHEFPTLEVVFDGEGRQPIRLRFTCDDWDARPPSVDVFSKGGGALAKIPEAPGQQFHPGFGGGLFICMPGIREYHEHPQHRPDFWENYRGTSDFDLGGIITKVWFAWSKATP